jgi:hypothetical protein
VNADGLPDVLRAGVFGAVRPGKPRAKSPELRRDPPGGKSDFYKLVTGGSSLAKSASKRPRLQASTAISSRGNSPSPGGTGAGQRKDAQDLRRDLAIRHASPSVKASRYRLGSHSGHVQVEETLHEAAERAERRVQTAFDFAIEGAKREEELHSWVRGSSLVPTDSVEEQC